MRNCVFLGNAFPFAAHSAINLYVLHSLTFASWGHPPPSGRLINFALKTFFRLCLASSISNTAIGPHPAGNRSLALDADGFHGVGTGMGMCTRTLRTGGSGHTIVSKEGCANSRSQGTRELGTRAREVLGTSGHMSLVCILPLHTVSSSSPIVTFPHRLDDHLLPRPHSGSYLLL